LLELPHPFLTNEDMARLRHCEDPDFRPVTLDATFAVPKGFDPSLWLDPEADLPPEALHAAGLALREGVDGLCQAASAAVAARAGVLIVSDRKADGTRAAIPSLLAAAAVHHHLVRTGDRLRVGLVLETGEVREVAHACLLLGFGVAAVNPYVALETVRKLARGDKSPEKAQQNYVKALCKGLLKTMSKMGVSAVHSYQGAQIFEAIGIDQRVIDLYFTGTPSRIRGVGLAEIAEEALFRHHRAFHHTHEFGLEPGGHHRFRVDGEPHLWTPASIAALQKAVRGPNDTGDARSYAEYARQINEPRGQPMTLRATWSLKPFGPRVPLVEVEPAVELVKRFSTGAMSFGSLSQEAHETLAVAMNRLGGKSNTGEGGEDPQRWVPEPNGDSRRSAIKQVASGRFGVTTAYLVNADDIQIKMAQGAKPGEGGQLPGHKVDAVIAKVRHSTPGVTLISPPPHHDIYSIEDLAQLIFDLKNVNPRARISVKLVAEAGIGTIAAGVAKAHADVILISGHDGGTGAAPLTSIQHTGAPWELGLAEAQQVLVMNGLRSRVRLQADGQLKTGRDALFAALLGAEEFGFATAPLVATGCVMMRKCHLNTCPVGVATQDPELRKRFRGKPEHVINYLFFVAEEMRALMAELGFRRLDEAIGRTECIVPSSTNPEGLLPRVARKVRKLDCSEVLYLPPEAFRSPRRCTEAQDHNLSTVLDHRLIQRAESHLANNMPMEYETPISNGDRAFGSMLAGLVTQKLWPANLPDDHLRIRARGSAGQSFGAWACSGMSLTLEGDANDYVGKGLSGGIIAVRPFRKSTFVPEKQVIVGNTVLYGATSGKGFFNGRAGERFGVRNSGATAVVEGLGDHGCEYMTGGTVLVLGSVGRNFAAGMSGGVAYVLDLKGTFPPRCNREMVELHSLGEADFSVVQNLLNEHIVRTGSPLAQRLFAQWDEMKPNWLKVEPIKAGKALSSAEKTGTPQPPMELKVKTVAPVGPRSARSKVRHG
jgi:glutamate synthase (NADPH/NADH) large chain